MENRPFDHYIVGTACSKCGREFKRTVAWCRTHGAIECPCGGRIQVRYETLMRMLNPGEQGGQGRREEEAALKAMENELRDYALDHPNLSDQDLQRHVFEALNNHLGREWISVSSDGAGGIEVVFDEDL